MKMILIEKKVWNVVEDEVPEPITNECKKADEKSHSTKAKRKIMNLLIEEGGDVEAHVIRMNELFQRMSALGGEITQDLIFNAKLFG